jgi:CubicO group peptidase (beta-lactamase class C family)
VTVFGERRGAGEPWDFGDLVDRARLDVERGRTPACQLAVARNGSIELFETIGAAPEGARFHVFSATKPLVASVIWMLMAEGLDVTLPVASLIPEFGTNGKDVVTLEQVLLHTCGFPSAPVSDLATRSDRLGCFSEWKLEWEPGTRFAYHPVQAHWVLAEIIERWCGRDFRDVVADRATTPLGLPRVLGIPSSEQGGIVDLVAVGGDNVELGLRHNDVAVRAAGVPGGGGIMTAADLALIYQAFLSDPSGLWDPAVLADATGTIRCRLEEPLFKIPVNRSIGLVIAGDDGQHTLRYAGFGEGCSPAAFGHAGAYMQVAWADPATGASFVYLSNGLDDQIRAGARGLRLSSLAAAATAV